MTETDARRHPWRNVVTRALAGGEDPEIDVAEIELRHQDRVVLCSDGLHGVVAPERFTAIMKQAETLEQTCRTLVTAANEAGGPDNITVAILHVDVE